MFGLMPPLAPHALWKQPTEASSGAHHSPPPGAASAPAGSHGGPVNVMNETFGHYADGDMLAEGAESLGDFRQHIEHDQKIMRKQAAVGELGELGAGYDAARLADPEQRKAIIANAFERAAGTRAMHERSSEELTEMGVDRGFGVMNQYVKGWAKGGGADELDTARSERDISHGGQTYGTKARRTKKLDSDETWRKEHRRR